MSGKPFTPTDYDVKLGRILATTRIRFGMSQKDVAKKSGVTFQQIQKYETADNRLSVSRLNKIVSECFGMTIGAFLSEMEKPYNHDKHITNILRTLYNMNDDGRKLIEQLVFDIAPNYTKQTKNCR